MLETFKNRVDSDIRITGARNETNSHKGTKTYLFCFFSKIKNSDYKSSAY